MVVDFEVKINGAIITCYYFISVANHTLDLELVLHHRHMHRVLNARLLEFVLPALWPPNSFDPSSTGYKI